MLLLHPNLRFSSFISIRNYFCWVIVVFIGTQCLAFHPSILIFFFFDEHGTWLDSVLIVMPPESDFDFILVFSFSFHVTAAAFCNDQIC